MLSEVVLEGSGVRLEPLRLSHVDALCDVGLDEALWQWIPTRVTARDEMRRYVAEALAAQAAGAALPFAIVECTSGRRRVVGSTRYYVPDRDPRRLEIGWSWVGRAWWRSGVNVEAKLLLLAHAFERLGCFRVELKTDALNERSRRAILALGATEEGTFRRHRMLPDGRIRDTVYFSIIDNEWPAVRDRLHQRLARHATVVE
jgi:RimJ/RimL family protein N-acetyltransferase